VISARITKLHLLCGLTLSTIPGCPAQQAQNQPLQLQAQYQSLQITIRQTSPKPLFQIELHNIGKEPQCLALGEQFPGMQEVTAIHLSLTDTKGKTLTLSVNDPHTPVVGEVFEETVSLPVVTLQPGETHSFQVDFKDYGSLPLASGQYSLQAVYIGKDLPHDPPIQYWTGTATSNTL
jgi:hypothetical protein